MAGGYLRRGTQIDPVARRRSQVHRAQQSEAKAGCVSEIDWECACRQLCGLRQRKRRRHHACQVEQLAARAGKRWAQRPSIAEELQINLRLSLETTEAL